MMKSCVIKPQVKNTKGEYVDSELFNSLYHYTNKNRELSKQYYSIGTNEEFLSRVGNEAVFDENGEIIFQSLRNLASLNLEEESIKKILNDDIKSGIYSYSEAIPRLQSFNRSSPYNDKYMATLIPTFNSDYVLKVVEKTVDNEVALQSLISGMSLMDRIKFYLNKAGADFAFLDKDSGIKGRYSTINAKKTADNLYQLIKVANNESVESTLAEEAGHFAVGALGNSLLVKRLEGLMTTDVQKQIMGDEYDTIAYRENPAREVAGYLVGKGISKELDKRTIGATLVDRIISQIKKVFANITKNDVNQAILNAENIADSIAKGFMSPDFQGDVEVALNTKETLFNAPDSGNIKTFKKVLNILKLQVSEMKSINKSLQNKYAIIEGNVEMGRISNSPSLFANINAVDGMVTALNMLVEYMPEITQKLNSIGDAEKGILTEHLTPENGTTLREVTTFLRNAEAILSIISEATKPDSTNLISDASETTMGQLEQLQSTLSDLLNHPKYGLLDSLKTKQSKFFLRFLEDAMGSKFVTTSAKKVFNWRSGKLENFIPKEGGISIQSIMESLESDISLFDRFLASMGNNADVVSQLIDKVTKTAKKIANDNTISAQDYLRVLREDLLSLGINDTSIFMETSSRTGRLTGNIISEHNWGDYEEDWLEFKNTSKEEFFESTNLEGKSEHEKSLLWGAFFKPRAKSWHKQHSVFNADISRYSPNDSYLNPKYNNTIGKNTPTEKWLFEYRKYKDSLDSLIPEGSTASHRLPQFKGNTINKINNRRLTEGTGKSVLYTLKRNIIDTFCEDSEDTDYGSDQTYNTINEDIFSNQLSFEEDKLNRLPLFGINKLKDSSEISTDLFQSTLAYAAMAHNYKMLESIVHTLEVGKEVLRRRVPGGFKGEDASGSGVYKRLQKYYDKQLYNISMPKLSFKFFGQNVIVNKVADFFTRMASIVYLGGNVVGGAINVSTGSIEIFKEALAGEYFSAKSWTKANKEYFSKLPENLLNAGNLVKNDKISLFIRHFNIGDNNEQKYREYFTRESKLKKILNPLGDNLFLPYKSGEHYMQTMSFLSIAMDTKLVDDLGNNISMYDAYEVVPISDESPNTTLRLKDGIRVKDGDELRPWNTIDESNFINKSREINNRLHGIYNNHDKTAIQQNIFGNMLLSMRGYALGMIQRRFGTGKYISSLNQEVEGSMITFGKTILSAFGNKEALKLATRAIFLPTGESTKQRMLDAGFSSNQYYNMRRNWGDMMIIAALTILKTLTSKGEDDDDEEDEYVNGLLYYYSSRLLTEQSGFNTPWGIAREAPTLTKLAPAGYSVAEDMVKLGGLIITGEEYKSNGPNYDKGDAKWASRVERILPYYKSYLLLQNPYQAAESYQYGRTTLK